MAISISTPVKFDFPDFEKLSYQQIASMELYLKEVGKEILNKAKANLNGHKRTGALSKALKIKSKVKEHKEGGHHLYMLIGIDNKYETIDEYGNTVKPTKYAKFIEFGTENTTATNFFSKATSGKVKDIEKNLIDIAKKAQYI